MPDPALAYPQRLLLNTIVTALTQVGDWRALVADLRARRDYGPEYGQAADLLEARGLDWERYMAEACREPVRRRA